jgi:hypothetical protein
MKLLVMFSTFMKRRWIISIVRALSYGKAWPVSILKDELEEFKLLILWSLRIENQTKGVPLVVRADLEVI